MMCCGLCELILLDVTPRKPAKIATIEASLLEPSPQVRLVHVIPYLTLLPHIFLETNQLRKTAAAQALACSRC